MLTRSIGKKLIVAISGLGLVFFILFHLAGNLLVLFGPNVFNGYAARLESLGPLLWVVRIGLAAFFIVHIVFTIWVTLDNRKARQNRYEVFEPKGGERWTTATMIYTGLLLFFFLFLHLYDFSFTDRHGELSVVAGASTSESLGLYGLVWNRFLNIPRSIIYILAVTAVGMHFAHGFQSLFQTLGYEPQDYGGAVQRLSLALGAVLAVGFSAIPIYVIIRHLTAGVGV